MMNEQDEALFTELINYHEALAAHLFNAAKLANMPALNPMTTQGQLHTAWSEDLRAVMARGAKKAT